MSSGNVETEVKIRLADPDELRERLGQHGFTQRAARQFESNSLYDTPQHELRRNGALLRLRQFGERSVITWKGRGEARPFKTRPELETGVDSLDTARQILERLGYVRTFRYEKFRTEYVEAGNPEGGVLTFDETPIGTFLELEGSGEWIDRKASQLGFSKEDYILSSYGTLYLEECKRRGVEPADMVFASHSQ
jgi:adenylate cyclase class 2